ncbi:MAG TPA: sensor domain-containing diguanylate cyclase [Thermoanaerobaculaceae bacterium]|nr:sensor domain-containing diguanylate cyclase [Thermoanaerobaculaceae bacterium]HRS16363.1 sensor domain-containing diguanylate cyclase [Thermoanaerobaculaceae bacterium]
MDTAGREVHVLPPANLEPFLERYRLDSGTFEATDASRFISEVLRRANAFVPSEAGSVLLDNPFERTADPTNHSLYFIAAFGPAAASLLGASIPTSLGVVGHVYRTGESYVVSEAQRDPHFLPHFDETLAFRTASLVAVPIRLQSTVCGVLELVNRREGRAFDERDRDLLEIFAAYTSLAMQTLLDARRASEAARSDDLTGLGNDRFFHRRLAAALEHADASGGRVALLFLDLDNFKHVNDTHGHLAGSQVLKEVGYLLRRVVRIPGATLARYGGDEFVVIVPGFDAAAAHRVAEDIRLAMQGESFLRGRFSWADGPVEFAGPLTCSVGVAVYPDHVPREGSSDRRRNQLLRSADQAMYAAKAAGKNLVLLAPLAPK